MSSAAWPAARRATRFEAPRNYTMNQQPEENNGQWLRSDVKEVVALLWAILGTQTSGVVCCVACIMAGVNLVSALLWADKEPSHKSTES
jgi:hypothetical protein